MPLSSASCHHTPWKLELSRNRRKGNEAGLKVVPKETKCRSGKCRDWEEEEEEQE